MNQRIRAARSVSAALLLCLAGCATERTEHASVQDPRDPLIGRTIGVSRVDGYTDVVRNDPGLEHSLLPAVAIAQQPVSSDIWGAFLDEEQTFAGCAVGRYTSNHGSPEPTESPAPRVPSTTSQSERDLTTAFRHR